MMAEIRMTDKAAAALGPLIAREGGAVLRIYVDHRCHCGGVKYGMALGQALPGETRLDVSGIRVSVTPDVARALGTVDVDFVESLLQSGFTLTDSEHVCGMGHAG